MTVPVDRLRNPWVSPCPEPNVADPLKGPYEGRSVSERPPNFSNRGLLPAQTTHVR
jgi:hypothetical protein